MNTLRLLDGLLWVLPLCITWGLGAGSAAAQNAPVRAADDVSAAIRRRGRPAHAAS
jgi:hypothetical protein